MAVFTDAAWTVTEEKTVEFADVSRLANVERVVVELKSEEILSESAVAEL